MSGRARPVLSTRSNPGRRTGGIPDPWSRSPHGHRRARWAFAESASGGGERGRPGRVSAESPGAILALPRDPAGWGAQSGLSARAHERKSCKAPAQMEQLSHVQQRPAASTLVSRPAAKSVKRVIIAGVLVSAAVFALLAGGQLIDYGVLNLRIRVLNTDTHRSVFGVASLLAEVAAAAAITWRANTAERRRWGWFSLGALVAGLVLFPGRG